MVRRAGLALEPKMGGNFPKRGHHSSVFLMRRDEIEQFPLLPGQLCHSVLMDTIRLSCRVNYFPAAILNVHLRWTSQLAINAST